MTGLTKHPINPFTNRKMIIREEEFVGRNREIVDILNRLRTCNSVSLVGDRRIGKSSLIYNFYLTGNHRLNDPNKKKYQFIYLDFHSSDLRTPLHFVESIFRILNVEFDAEELSKRPLSVFTLYLEDLKNSNSPQLILLLDEFEEITQHAELFNDSFLEGLRSMCNSGKLTLVTVTRHSLKELTTKGNLTSPFWNIFVSRSLDVFRVEKNIDEVEEFLEKYWSTNHLQLTSHEKEFIKRHGSRHPLKLQVTCYWVLENRNFAYSPKRLKREIDDEMKSYFRSWGEERRKGIYGIPNVIAVFTKWTGERIKELGSLLEMLGLKK